MKQKNSPGSSFTLETLEDRTLLAWGAYPVLIGQDQAAANYPSINGRGQLVVNLDSGVNLHHPALAGRIWTNPGEIAGNGRDDDNDGLVDNRHGYDYVNNDGDPSDDQGHGTMTGGIMVANKFTNTGNSRGYAGDRKEYAGVASGAQIVSLKVVSSGLGYSIGNVEKALRWVINNHRRLNITAVNMSLDVGSGGYAVIKDELQTLWSGGVFIGASSGNGGNWNNVLAYPANTPNSMSVGGVNVNGTVNSVTSRGPSLDILAPGNQVPYLDRGASYWLGGQGTSFAAPFGTAAAMLVKQVNRAFSNDQIVSILKDSGTNVYDSASRLTFKALNVNKAIALAYSRSGQAAPAPAPVPAPAPAPAPSLSSTPTSTASRRSAFTMIQAETYDVGSGITRSSNAVGSLDRADSVGYKGVDFGAGGAVKIEMKLAVPAAFAGKQVQIRVGSATGTIIGTLTTKSTGAWGAFTSQYATISKQTGVKDIYFTFTGDGTANLDAFRFLAS